MSWTEVMSSGVSVFPLQLILSQDICKKSSCEPRNSSGSSGIKIRQEKIRQHKQEWFCTCVYIFSGVIILKGQRLLMALQQCSGRHCLQTARQSVQCPDSNPTKAAWQRLLWPCDPGCRRSSDRTWMNDAWKMIHGWQCCLSRDSCRWCNIRIPICNLSTAHAWK